ncbi:MAG: hypothetical protein ACI4T2_02375 [Christensenellales bacterium]
MSIASIVSLVVNIVFVLMLGLGFLFGFKRGVKRSGLRIGLFLVFVIIGAVVSPYITEAILGIKFNWPNGMRDTILKYLESLFRQNPDISNMLTYNASLNSALRQTIIIVCNFATFIAVALIMTFISWIVFMILAKYVIRDKKRKETIEEIKKNTTNTYDLTPKPEKKYRFFGSLIGLLQGFVLAFIIFIPISGLMATAQSVLDTASQSQTTTIVTTAAESTDGGEENNKLPATLGDLVAKYVPQEYLDIIPKYRKSAIGAIASVGDLDKACFDAITTLQVRGQKFTLRSEIENACNLYEKFIYLYEFDFANNDLSKLDFEITDQFVDLVFSSDFVYAVSSDIVPYALEKLVVQNDDLKLGNYTGLVKGEGMYSGVGVSKFIEVLRKTESPSAEIEKDVREVYDIAKLLIQEGIADDIKNGNINVTKILDSITAPKEDGTILTQTINHLMKTNTLKVVLNMGFNAGLKALDENISSNLGTVRYNEEVWAMTEEDAQKFANNLSSTYTYFNSLDTNVKDAILSFSFDENMFESLKTVNLNELVLPVARALDIVNESTLFNQYPDGKEAENKPVIDRIIESVYESDVFEPARKYIKLTVANNNGFKFENDIGKIIEVINRLQEKDCMKLIFTDSLDVEQLFAKFDETKTAEPLTFDQTFGVIIDNELFRPTFVCVLNLMNSKLGDVLGTTIETKELSADVDVSAQKEDIKTFWTNLLPLSSEIFKEEGFKLKNLDFDSLENLMEGMKKNVYDVTGATKENSVFEAMYLNLIDYIKNDEDYGIYFTEYYDSYSNPYDVDWHKLLAAVKIADDLKETGSISPSDLNKVAELASTSEAIAGAVKDAVKEKVADEELKTKIDGLDLTDNSTLSTIENVAKIADSLQKLGTEQPTIGKDVESFINGLNNQANQDTVDTIIGIVDNVAKSEIVENSSKISESEKESIEKNIDNASRLSEETKNRLREMFGLPTEPESESST